MKWQAAIARLPGAVAPRREKLWLGLVLAAGLLHGLLFVFLVPPWQHYDEPGRFEYAWLIANRPGLPEVGDYDAAMRRDVAASMVEHGFFAGLGQPPSPLATPAWIGISQLDDPPVYYWLAALPLRLVPTSDVTLQLYLARLVSLSLYLVSLAAAYGCITELTRPGHPLRWLVPLALALLPGYTDLMTSVNNDVGAAAFGSLFLWCGLRLVRRGFDIRMGLLAVVLAGMCVGTKNTAAPAALLLIPALLLAFLRGKQFRFAWGISLALLVAGMVWTLRLDGAASWYRRAESQPVQCVTAAEAPLGRHALRLSLPHSWQALVQVMQPVAGTEMPALRGQVVTLGAWMWASRPLEMQTPVLSDGTQSWFDTIQIGTQPAFFAFSASVPEDATRLWIELRSPVDDGSGAVQVWVDGVVLARGDWAGAPAPVFSAARAEQGEWQGAAFVNLARNASFESLWLQGSWAVDGLLAQAGSLPITEGMASLSDLPVARWYYQTSLENLLRTFWGRFGWGHVALLGPKPYRFLGVVAAVGGLGALLTLWQQRRRLDWNALGWLGAALALVWGAALWRGAGSLTGLIFIPGARYAILVIVPTVLLLVQGWRKVCSLARLPGWVASLGMVIFFLGLDVWAWASIAGYYHH